MVSGVRGEVCSNKKLIFTKLQNSTKIVNTQKMICLLEVNVTKQVQFTKIDWIS